jgi:hypothetical protein
MEAHIVEASRRVEPPTAGVTRDQRGGSARLQSVQPLVLAMDTETITDTETIMEGIGVSHLSVLPWPRTTTTITDTAIMGIQAISGPLPLATPPHKTLDSLKTHMRWVESGVITRENGRPRPSVPAAAALASEG